MTETDSNLRNNPLLEGRALPRFAAIEPQHIEPAVRHVLAAEREAIATASATAPTIAWLADLERVHEAVHGVWGPVAHLNNVVSTPELRDAFNRCLPLITEFEAELGQNEALYRQFVALDGALSADVDAQIRALVTLSLRDFRLAGVALDDAARQRFRAVMLRLAECQARFEHNLMDATDHFSHHETDAAALAGLPETLLERARAAAVERGLDGWRLALDAPTYQAVVTHADSRALREFFYRAWVTRSSELGPEPERWNNGPVIDEILALRHEAATLLGFANFAEFSLATKMARSPAEVIGFLEDLVRRVKPRATRELAGLATYAGMELEAWDVPYFAEKLRNAELALSEESLRPYFPLPRVLAGLFALAERLFGLTIEERPPAAPLWHDSVRYYRLRRRDGSDVGGVLTDLFARPNKRGGAWMDSCAARARLPSRARDPIAYLVCNFAPPLGAKPSLLTHSEVVTLFHEFGHTLHHLLTEVDYPSISGINGVAWDAVELPSQFLENYAWLPDVLASISAHYETGEPLPAATIATLSRSRTFLTGLAMVRQLEFALFDFRVHSEPHAVAGSEVDEILASVRADVAVIPAPDYNRFPRSFAHVFGGGYAAGYYSYKWAEVLAADAFSAFAETGAFDVSTADRFRRSILAVGGSREALAAFVDFRGRAPTVEPLLRQAGIVS